MKLILLAALVALTGASLVKDEMHMLLTKDNMEWSHKMKETMVLKLLNHIMQPTIYDDIRTVARDFVLEDNMDKFVKHDVFKKFLDMYKLGMMLPRGEIFVHDVAHHIKQAVRVFRLMYFAKDFSTFMKTACWLRERINGGMFVYALTAAVFHRADCRGIALPAPYEIYPYFFVDSQVMNKAMMMKMTRAVTDPMLMNYYGIQVTDKNLVVIDWRKGMRHSMSKTDRLTYFTEDIDLNTYMYYLHMNYPFWMKDEDYGLHKTRRGEVMMYAGQQLLARMNLERMSHHMCSVKALSLNKPIKNGYWPKLWLNIGVEMPARFSNVMMVSDEKMPIRRMIDDTEAIIRDAILKRRIILNDGTVITIKKPEDIEWLARMILGGLGMKDDAKLMHMTQLFKRLLTYNQYNMEKNTYIPTALDMYTTCLRDPVYWKIIKRINENFEMFKRMMPKYKRDDLDFPGVKIERLVTDKLVTFMDEYDMDITNGVYLDAAEMKKGHSNMRYVARAHRLNHQPFKITMEVVSDKAVDAVVRVFIGPKWDCMGRLMDWNERRHMMVEMDTFLYKLETGKNTIIRDSMEMHNVMEQRPWMSFVMDNTVEGIGKTRVLENFWWKTRIGFPHRLLLPKGHRGGLELMMYAIVTPVRTNTVIPMVDMTMMKERHDCRWASCIDTMPLGYPFDREIDAMWWHTKNMMMTDVTVWWKDMSMSNVVKSMDTSNWIMKYDDLTYLDKDMMVKWNYKDVMLMSADRMTRM